METFSSENIIKGIIHYTLHWFIVWFIFGVAAFFFDYSIDSVTLVATKVVFIYMAIDFISYLIKRWRNHGKGD